MIISNLTTLIEGTTITPENTAIAALLVGIGALLDRVVKIWTNRDNNITSLKKEELKAIEDIKAREERNAKRLLRLATFLETMIPLLEHFSEDVQFAYLKNSIQEMKSEIEKIKNDSE